MPEPLLFLLLAVLLAAAVHCLANASSRRPVPPPPTPPTPKQAPVHMAACHNIRCGAHNRTVHRVTEDGLVCEDCGQLTPRTP